MKRLIPALAGALVWARSNEALAAAEGEDGILPPVVRDMMVILSMVLCILVLVGLVVNFLSVRGLTGRVAKAEKAGKNLRSLTADVEKLKNEIFPDVDLSGVGAAASTPPLSMPKPAPPPEAEESKGPAWQDFLSDYNTFARSVDVPRVEQACDNFIELHEIRLLMCLKKGTQEEPRFAPVSEIDADYWAWHIPKTKGKFAVVPNPTITYTEKVHEEGGMKETFASNYDSGIYRHVEVKLPAIFVHKDDKWTIEQPGVIRLGDA